ncbi:uncharacterized protein L969DRAFT_96245 [Mixia osmundae IAM 14324]|uniref:BHLH domain-containing protein n=1 Tax=Mixia osmundae (strain CBS 9802 / IAM 14324 / JCM 22182 / KY 12970) TaxID=764103 RepID=G7E4V4_MIXOS|nr:uncharacterized protein L969DRAFT_96245 [Mixia osmundae IAM 14324]KEI37727.1 hypothetical protein L969DRAFT_96245 [Mixia osmundae IAM 14324]GAA97864.1 hypothetical protein E5Q_04544 [Mixia osmundae IAM 14324]
MVSSTCEGKLPVAWAPPTPDSLLVPVQHSADSPPELDLDAAAHAKQPASTAQPSDARALPTQHLQSRASTHHARGSSVSIDSLLNPQIDSKIDNATFSFASEPDRPAKRASEEQELSPIALKTARRNHEYGWSRTPSIRKAAVKAKEAVWQATLENSTASSESDVAPRAEDLYVPAAAELVSNNPQKGRRAPLRSDSGKTAANSKTSRKISHSLIERRRREKINDCLQSLAHLVPECRAQVSQHTSKARERAPKTSCARSDEPAPRAMPIEKLSVLQGTLTYIHRLHDRVRALEQRCGLPLTATPRLHDATEEDEEDEVDEEGETVEGDSVEDAASLLLAFAERPLVAKSR